MAKLEQRITPEELLAEIKTGKVKNEIVKEYRASDQELALMLQPLFRSGEMTKEEFNKFFMGLPFDDGKAGPQPQPRAHGRASAAEVGRVGEPDQPPAARQSEVAIAEPAPTDDTVPTLDLVDPDLGPPPESGATMEGLEILCRSILARLDALDRRLSHIEEKSANFVSYSN